jgi:hypothetical protein
MQRQWQASGDHSAAATPVPIPNTEVKRYSPDDSASIGCAKVGNRQNPFLVLSTPARRKGAGVSFWALARRTPAQPGIQVPAFGLRQSPAALRLCPGSVAL